ncbi:hypothetical protein B7463_g8031, partial [Scytalidium lignicola]
MCSLLRLPPSTRAAAAGLLLDFAFIANSAMSHIIDKTSPIVIIGAGIFGLSTAIHLAQRGYKYVTILDKQPYDKSRYSYDAGCDAASAGKDINKIIRAGYGAQVEYQDMAIDAIAHWQQWNSEIKAGHHLPTGFRKDDMVFVNNGSLDLTSDVNLSQYELDSISNMTKSGFRSTQVVLTDAQDVARAKKEGFEFAVNPFKRSPEKNYGLLDTMGGFVYADKACRFALHKAKTLGVETVLGGAAGTFKSFLRDPNSKITGVKTVDDCCRTASLVIMACGGWTPSIVPQMDNLCETTGGSVSIFQLPTGSPLWDRFSPENFPTWAYNIMHGEEGGLYGFARDPYGAVKIGYRGTKYTNPQRQPDGAIRSVPITRWTENSFRQLPQTAANVIRRFVEDFLPELIPCEVKTRLCWYTDSFDNHFVIDFVPDMEGVMVATGGSGHAFKFLPTLDLPLAAPFDTCNEFLFILQPFSLARYYFTMPDNLTDGGVGSTTLWPPGTVTLEDLHASSGKQIILQPSPTDNPNDPLNWSNRRKYLNFALACLYVIMISECINAATPTWDPMHVELGYSYDILNDSYAAGCASLAVGAVLLIPFALKFGRRPLYILSTIVQLIVSVWSAKMQNVADLMLTNVFQCLFGALAEVIVQMTIADVFFVHQRGRMNSLYIWSWSLSASIGPLIAGFITADEGWRWVWWWNAIFFSAMLLIVIFCYEETKYCPPSISIPNLDVFTDNEGHHHSNPALSGKPHHRVTDGTSVQPVEIETKMGSNQDGALPALSKTLEEGSVHGVYTLTINPNIRRKTYLERLAITTTSPSNGDRRIFFRHMYQPLILLATIPAIVFVALVYGILVALGDLMATTSSTYMSKPPYNFNSGQIGLMSLPRLIGTTIGSLIVGPLSDWIILYLSRRNKGIYEPEVRLWCVLPFLLFIPTGALMYGIGLNNGLPWPIVAAGLVIYFVGIAPVNSVTLTYLTDSYKDIIGDALVGVTVVRNTFSTIFIFALSPWVRAVGIKWALITIILIACAVLSFFVVFLRWGKTFRARSAARYHHYALQQYKERSLRVTYATANQEEEYPERWVTG